MPCSRTQHGLTRMGLEPPTSGSAVRGINHQATALPRDYRDLRVDHIYSTNKDISTSYKDEKKFADLLNSLNRRIYNVKKCGGWGPILFIHGK